MGIESTLVLVKPDGVQRGLIGEVVKRFEQVGLKVTAMKMVLPSKALAERHYPLEKGWYEPLWKKTKENYESKGISFKETAIETGTRVRNGLLEGLTSGPVVAMVVEGNYAVPIVRKIVGATAPEKAEPGSIRGMFSTDSYDLADKGKRAVRNIVHASDLPDTAKREIAVWFTKEEIHKYRRADENIVN